jgi:hypothetical protein
MPSIRATCTDCGDVDLVSEDVRVRVCVDDGTATYSFRCPACHMVVVKPAEPRVVDLLAAAGVHVARWHLPAELREPRGSGGPVTHDELLEFHRGLVDDARFSSALDRLRRAS